MLTNSAIAVTSVNIVIWTTIEANAVIISACIPMLMPFVELVFGENFLRGGVNGQLPTIRSSSEPAASSESSDVGMKASERQREDWMRQVRGT
jgi:hypothetical protein